MLNEELNLFVLAVIANLKREQCELKIQFDDESIKIFDFNRLPRIVEVEESISNIKFDLDLSNMESNTINEVIE